VVASDLSSSESTSTIRKRILVNPETLDSADGMLLNDIAQESIETGGAELVCTGPG
jgi:hypothetical protein